jgi:hypothetical protein
MAGNIADAQRDMAAAPTAQPLTELKAGTLLLNPPPSVTATTRDWQVSVGTNVITAIATEHVTPYHNAPCVVGMVTQPGGQTIAWVLGVTQSGLTEGATGKVLTVPGGSATITVDVNGKTLSPYIVTPYAPAVNDVCLLEQRGGVLYALGKVGVAASTAAAPPPPAAPPEPVQTGASEFRAQDSGTWTNGYNWNSYFGQDCYSGSGYVPPSSGHWFYNNATTALADKTTGAIRMYLGARKNAGAYNSPATVHFYRHTSGSKGSSQPATTHGPHDVVIPAGWGGGWIGLHESFATALKGGGGISIVGDPYVGFVSGAAAPASGTLSVDWSK